MRAFTLFFCVALLAGAQTLTDKVVLLDGYHNDETKNPLHYRWEGTDNGGFSKLAEVLKGLGAELQTTSKPLDRSSLSGVTCLIIVDPDTPAESQHPHFISDEEIEVLVRWVSEGGRLVLLGNDKGNAEFEHLNRLAGRFGFDFVEDTVPKVAGKAILRAEGQGPIFEGAPRFYGVELAPLRLTEKGTTDVLLSYENTPIMVLAHKSRGLVFGLGDPWIYNEYINRDDNEEIARKLFLSLLR